LSGEFARVGGGGLFACLQMNLATCLQLHMQGKIFCVLLKGVSCHGSKTVGLLTWCLLQQWQLER
jgi:hypothetical protein